MSEHIRLKVELDWLKKNLDLSPEEKKMLIEPANPDIPIYRQCQLLGVSRSSYYYKPAGESQYNLLLMRLIDEQYTKAPFYGVPRMTAYLRSLGHHVNHKRVERLIMLVRSHPGYTACLSVYPDLGDRRDRTLPA